MAGTFRFGDSLIVEPVNLNDVRKGNVLVFRGFNRKGADDELVHRVMEILSEGLVMRGDNNPCVDSTLVTEENLVGRVTHLVRGGQIFHVHGGQFILLWVRFQHGLRYMRGVVWRMIRGMGRSSYRWLRDSGMVAHVWHPSIVRVQLMTENGPLIKYVCRNHTVAFHWIDDGRFKFLKPYDLLLWHEKLKKRGNVLNSGQPL